MKQPISSVATAFSVLGAFALATVPADAGNGPAPTLPELLTRHAQAVGRHAAAGGPAVAVPGPVQVSGTLEAGGLHGTFVTTEKAPDKVYTQTALGDDTFSSGYDGKNAWQEDANGNVRLLTREELKGERTNEEPALQAGIDASHLVLRPAVDRDSGDYVIDAQPTGGRPMVIFLDPQTFLVRKTQVPYDDRTVTTTYLAWQTEDGVTRPSRWTVGSGTAKYDEVVSVTNVTRNVEAPDALFAMPTPTKNYHFLKPGATSATVPFQYQGTKIALTALFNGIPTRVALDSGAGGIALSQALTEELGLQTQGTFEGRGIGGSLSEHGVHLKTFAIADGVEFEGLSASTGIAVIDPSSVVPMTALVCYDLLSRFVVRIDYANQQVTFTEPDAFKPSTDDGTMLPLELDDNSPTVQAQFDDLPPARFLIDTGDPGTVRLNAPYVAANRLRDRYKKGRGVLSGGVGGAAEFDIAHARSLRLAGVTIPGIPASFPRDPRGGSSSLVAGAIGAQVLRRFVVTFDYPHQRLFLASNPASSQPFDTRTFGITVLGREDDKGKLHLYVVRLDPESPAHKGGVQFLDEIEKIDGQSAPDLGVDEVSKRLSVDGGQPTHRLSVRHLGGDKGAVNVSLYDLLPSP